MFTCLPGSYRYHSSLRSQHSWARKVQRVPVRLSYAPLSWFLTWLLETENTFSPEKRCDKCWLFLRPALRSPCSTHAAGPWEDESCDPQHCFYGKMCSSSRTRSSFLPPLPTSMSNESSVFIIGNAAPECGQPGIMALDALSTGRKCIHSLTSPALPISEGDEDRWEVFPDHLLQCRAPGILLGDEGSKNHNFWRHWFEK